MWGWYHSLARFTNLYGGDEKMLTNHGWCAYTTVSHQSQDQEWQRVQRHLDWQGQSQENHSNGEFLPRSDLNLPRRYFQVEWKCQCLIPKERLGQARPPVSGGAYFCGESFHHAVQRHLVCSDLKNVRPLFLGKKKSPCLPSQFWLKWFSL